MVSVLSRDFGFLLAVADSQAVQWRGRSDWVRPRTIWSKAAPPPLTLSMRLRITVAMTRVLYGEPMKEVLQRLLQLASRIGVKPRYLLLDRGFYSVEVVRYLQAARCPFLMPVARRGRKPRHPEQSKSVWRFFAWKRNRCSWGWR